MCGQKSLQVCNFRESEAEYSVVRIINGRRCRSWSSNILCTWNYKLEQPLMKEGLRGNHTVYSVLDLGALSFAFEMLRILG